MESMPLEDHRQILDAAEDRIAELEAQLAEARERQIAGFGWQRTKSHLPEPGRHVLLMTTDRFWSVPDGVPETNVSATGYLQEIHGHKGWTVFGKQGMELFAFDLWMYVPEALAGEGE